MTRVARLAGVLLLLGCCVTVATVATASPQPKPICTVCGPAFETAADSAGVEVNVTRSRARVQIHENGSAAWVVRNRLKAADARGLTNDTVADIVERAAVGTRGLPGGVTVKSVRLEDRTVRLRLRDSDAADRQLGLLVVDVLHTEGVRGGWRHTADEFTITGPKNTTVVNDPRAPFDPEYTDPDARPTVNGSAVSWTQQPTSSPVPTNEYGAVTHEDLYIVYGAPETSGWHVDAALALATAPIWLDNVVPIAPLVAVLYGLVVLVAVPVARQPRSKTGNPFRTAGICTVLGLGGLVTALVIVATDGPAAVGGFASIYLVTGVAGLTRPKSLQSIRGTLTVALASLVAVGLVFVGGTALSQYATLELLVLGKLVVAHLPIAMAPVFGHVIARRDGTGGLRAVGLPVLGAMATATLAVMAVVPYASRPWGLYLLLFSVGAVIVGIFTLPLVILAAQFWDADVEIVPEVDTEIDWPDSPSFPPTSGIGIGLTIFLLVVVVLLALGLLASLY